MKDMQTIARPYAKALFELALKHQALDMCSDALADLSTSVEDNQMQKLIDHPEVSADMLVDVLTTVIKRSLAKHKHIEAIEHAVIIIARQQRLSVLPEIYRQYEMLKAEHGRKCSGVVFTAVELNSSEMQKLSAGLEKKLNKTVELSQVIQPELLGGAKIQIGDMVIDGSIRGRLQRLSQTLSAAS
jgi:F-type H+-transporting ATPase subunit delta